ncbi:DUF2953 domain-containing protein [bacterium]|nr:DUF2953 domain-containing protein [bacterium]
MGIAWRKEDDVQYIRFEILKIAFQKKLGSRQAKQNKKLDEQSVPRKKDKMKKRRLYCIIANAVIHSPKWFLRFVGILHLKNFEIRGHLGVGDPACTGLVYGLLQSLYPFNWRCVHLSVTPYFCGRKYNGSIKLVFQLYFFQLLGSLLQAGIHFLWIFGRCHFNMKGRFAW